MPYVKASTVQIEEHVEKSFYKRVQAFLHFTVRAYCAVLTQAELPLKAIAIPGLQDQMLSERRWKSYMKNFNNKIHQKLIPISEELDSGKSKSHW